MHKKHIGNQAENTAKQYLIEHGMTYIQSNYACKTGEIDLIMKDNDTLVFREVRYRRSPDYGSAAETVTHTKQQKVIRATEYYLLEHDMTNHFCRFDIVGISGQLNQPKFEWIKDAFGGPGW